MSETWTDDWDDRLATPPPLPSYPGGSEAAPPEAEAATDTVVTRWSLVSLDGRATMRIPKRFVIGSGACCDLCLTEGGIAPHHAMLTVEDGVAYVTALSDAASLLDGQIIAGRERLHRDAALTFGAATFRVEHEGLLDEPETEALAQVAGEAAAAHQPSRPHPLHAARMNPPHITPQIDLAARSEHRGAPVRRRKSKTGLVFVIMALLIAAAWWVPRDFVDTLAQRSESQPPPVPPPSDAATRAAAPSEIAAVAAPTRAEPARRQEPQPVENVAPPAQAAATPPSTPVLPTQAAPAATEAPVDASSALLSEADALFTKGNLVTPRGRNAAERYVRVLQESPDSKPARERLDQIVGRVAMGAEDLILRQRFDAARQSMEQLAAAIPQRERARIGQQAQGRWRVVDLLLQADALMQQYRLVAPDDPNAVGLLREALRVEPHNAIADEMLSKAYGLLEVRRNQDSGVVSTLP